MSTRLVSPCRTLKFCRESQLYTGRNEKPLMHFNRGSKCIFKFKNKQKNHANGSMVAGLKGSDKGGEIDMRLFY